MLQELRWWLELGLRTVGEFGFLVSVSGVRGTVLSGASFEGGLGAVAQQGKKRKKKK